MRVPIPLEDASWRCRAILTAKTRRCSSNDTQWLVLALIPCIAWWPLMCMRRFTLFDDIWCAPWWLPESWGRCCRHSLRYCSINIIVTPRAARDGSSSRLMLIQERSTEIIVAPRAVRDGCPWLAWWSSACESPGAATRLAISWNGMPVPLQLLLLGSSSTYLTLQVLFLTYCGREISISNRGSAETLLMSITE